MCYEIFSEVQPRGALACITEQQRLYKLINAGIIGYITSMVDSLILELCILYLRKGINVIDASYSLGANSLRNLIFYFRRLIK